MCSELIDFFRIVGNIEVVKAYLESDYSETVEPWPIEFV